MAELVDVTNTSSSICTRDAGMPFFIVGVPRSGTTLLRLMMNMHSNIYIPPESHFIPQVARQLKNHWSLDEFWSAVSAHERFIEWDLDLDALRHRLDLVSRDLRSAFNLLFTSCAERMGKARWGDKTPGYVQHIPLLSGIFPDAKFIHLIRDGRDVACSLRHVPWHQGSVPDVAKYWSRLVEQGARDGRRLPGDRYIEVCYEEFVASPNETLQSICQFIGESFEAAMLAYHRERPATDIPNHRRRWHERTSEAVDQRSIGRWKRELSSEEVATFERYARPALRRFGYQPATMPSFSERAASFVKRLAFSFGAARRSRPEGGE